MSSSITASYRLQIHSDFRMQDAQKIVPYLEDLNISHLYLSPLTEAVPGSRHGYDVTDFSRISEERGGEAALEALDKAVRSRAKAMGLILDIVPNHMGIAQGNPYWEDILENGKASPYWSLFDIRNEDTFRSPTPEDGSLGYRRFFNIFDLVGVRVEDYKIFDLTHEKIIQLGKLYPSIAGVRVDHIDGLADPQFYLDRLRYSYGSIWVEKILAGNETLPPEWYVSGTTGYEFIHHVNNLMVNEEGFNTIRSFWQNEVQPQWSNFYDCTIEARREVLEQLFSPELERLIQLSSSSDESLREKARTFWTGLTVTLPVYRTYGAKDAFTIRDIGYVHQASQKAGELFGEEYTLSEVQFLPGLLNPRNDLEHQMRKEWQQLTGPVMAKGIEDRAHYRFTPLAALNEVGCDADVQKWGRRNYFRWANQNATDHPESLLCASTHDTKRSEDVRHRLYALADRPEEWIAFYQDSRRIAYDLLGDDYAVLPPEQYLFYQTVIGTWPLSGKIDQDYIDRLCQYMNKAVRESSLHTSWAETNEEYEQAVEHFVRTLLQSPDFTARADQYSQSVSLAGAFNSLSIQALKILGPGIPDIYQGTESWNFSLVDPDNRRDVDYNSLQLSLKRLKGHAQPALLRSLKEEWKNGAIKQWTTQQLLKIREKYIVPLEKPLSFLPLIVKGERKNNVVAYSIRSEDSSPLVVVVPRYPGQLLGDKFNSLSIPGENWGDTRIVLPEKKASWKNILEQTEIAHDRGAVPVRDIGSFPVSVLS